MKILYFGLDPSRFQICGHVTHLPLITICPLPLELVIHYLSIPHTHVLFTSRVSVEYCLGNSLFLDSEFICIGKATENRLNDFGKNACLVANEPSSEGVVELLKQLENIYILYPHSSISRDVITKYLRENRKGFSFPIYDTKPNLVQLPNLEEFDFLVFTSPSTVNAFEKICKNLPSKNKCISIGEVTQKALNKLFIVD